LRRATTGWDDEYDQGRTDSGLSERRGDVGRAGDGSVWRDRPIPSALRKPRQLSACRGCTGNLGLRQLRLPSLSVSTGVETQTGEFDSSAQVRGRLPRPPLLR